MAQLDAKGEQYVLADVEIMELHDLSLHLHSLSRAQNIINWQKSRMNWLQEGDPNTNIFPWDYVKQKAQKCYQFGVC